MPALESALKDSDEWVRLDAAKSLGELGDDPGIFMPVVIQSFGNANFDALGSKLEILTRYKIEAKAAVPILAEILARTPQSTNMTNIFIRDQVIAALLLIDVGTARKVTPAN